MDLWHLDVHCHAAAFFQPVSPGCRSWTVDARSPLHVMGRLAKERGRYHGDQESPHRAHVLCGVRGAESLAPGYDIHETDTLQFSTRYTSQTESDYMFFFHTGTKHFDFES